MLPFVAKLLVGRQLNFEKGKLSIFDQRVLIIPAGLMLIIIKTYLKDKKMEKSFYEAAKEGTITFCKGIARKSDIKSKGMLDILVNLTEMNGYGQIIPVKVDYENKVATFHLRGLPSEALRGEVKTNRPVDSYWCGLVAGGMSFVFNDDIDCVETRCVANGKESCEVVAAKADFLKKNYKNYVSLF